MGKNYVDQKDMEEVGRKGEQCNEKGSYEQEVEKRMPMNGDREQPDSGDQIVKEFRELSRQQDRDPAYSNGENVQDEEDIPRYGNAKNEEFRGKKEDATDDPHNEKRRD